MNAKSLGAFGYLVLFLDLFGFGTGLVEILGLGDSSALLPLKMWVSFLAVFIVGVGLIGLRKWAAILLTNVPFLEICSDAQWAELCAKPQRL